jgi:DNA-binding NtrC family response regulator
MAAHRPSHSISAEPSPSLEPPNPGSDGGALTIHEHFSGAPAHPLVLDSLAPQPASLALTDSGGEVRRLEEIENEVIRFAITHYRGQMSEVARRLSIGRSTLYRKLKDLGLDSAADIEDSISVAPK